MRLRGSSRAAAGAAVLAAALAAVAGHAALAVRDDGAARALADRLGLTDPALANEARYTRHPSLADAFTAFQDGPGSLDHFPSGSIVQPPRSWPGGRLEAGTP